MRGCSLNVVSLTVVTRFSNTITQMVQVNEDSESDYLHSMTLFT